MEIEKTDTYTSYKLSDDSHTIILNLSNVVNSVQLCFTSLDKKYDIGMSRSIPITNSFKSGDSYIVESDEETRKYTLELIEKTDNEGLINFIKDFYTQGIMAF